MSHGNWFLFCIFLGAVLGILKLAACPFSEPFCRDPACFRDAGKDGAR